MYPRNNFQTPEIQLKRAHICVCMYRGEKRGTAKENNDSLGVHKKTNNKKIVQK